MAAGTIGVLQITDLSWQIARVDVPQARLLADLGCSDQVLRTSILRVGHLVVLVESGHMPGNIRRHADQELRQPLQLLFRVVETRDHQGDDLHPKAHFVQATDGLQDGQEAPAQLAIVKVVEAFEVNFVKVHPRSQELEDLWGAIPIGDKGCQQTCRTGFLEDRHRPLAGYQRLVIGAHQHLGALLKSLPHQPLGGSSQRGTNRGRVTECLGRHPILTVATVQVTAKHSKAVGQCPRMCVKEGLLFDRVALHSPDIAPGNVERSASVVANLADAGLAIRDRAAVPTGETAHAVTVESLVKFAFADVLVDDIPQGSHIQPPKSADSPHPILLKNWTDMSPSRGLRPGPPSRGDPGAVGFLWPCPPFPASCPSKSTVAFRGSPPSQTPPCRFPAAGSSSGTPRARPGVRDPRWQQRVLPQDGCKPFPR